SPQLSGVYSGIRNNGRSSRNRAHHSSVLPRPLLQRSRPKGETAKAKVVEGDAANKFDWVSLKQNKRLFEMYEESVRGFKENYYLVRPITSACWKSIVYRGPKCDNNENVVVGPNGKLEEEEYARFHFH
ncbi:hypothetical protein A2U01_0041771, partial [Trifolium medium]|nr:hypothetical protein [Trifolium medium]